MLEGNVLNHLELCNFHKVYETPPSNGTRQFLYIHLLLEINMKKNILGILMSICLNGYRYYLLD